MCHFGAVKKVGNTFLISSKLKMGGAVGTERLFYLIYPMQLPDGWSETPCMLLNA